MLIETLSVFPLLMGLPGAIYSLGTGQIWIAVGLFIGTVLNWVCISHRLKVDKSAVEYCARLTEFYAQFRAVAVNYNQVVKALHSNFSEKKALAFLYKLERATMNSYTRRNYHRVAFLSLAQFYRADYRSEEHTSELQSRI